MALIDVKIPPLGESISSGVLAKWHVKNGDTVKKDQPLFELETDKITSDGVAEAPGVITLKAVVGDEVKIGAVVAVIDSSATAAVAAPSAPAPALKSEISNLKSGGEAAVQSPAVRRVAADTGIDPASVAGTGKSGRVTKGDILAASEAKPAAPAPVAAPSIAVAPKVSAPVAATRRPPPPPPPSTAGAHPHMAVHF